MSKLSNTLTLLNLLASGKKYSIKELADILEVTPRMIRVYKDDLEKAGIYLDTIRGPYGGYVLNKSIRLPERKFKKSDYEILDKYLNNCSTKEEKEKLFLLKDKIRGIYIGSKAEAKELKLDENTLNKYNILSRAIKERKKVEILYYSFDTGENERIIDPIELFLFKDGWFCAAFCEKKQDMRHFELKRIRKIKLLDEIF